MHYRDLTPYTYSNVNGGERVVNVGWLDANEPYERGRVPSHIIETLIELCDKPVNKTRGFYGSPFVPGYEWGYEVVCNGQKHLLGSAEIRVTGASGRVYAAPDLIVHYIKDIGYLPPEEFIQAVEELSRLRTKGIRGDPGP